MKNFIYSDVDGFGNPIQEKLIINKIRHLLLGEIFEIDESCEKSFYEFIKLSSVDRCAFSCNWPYIIQATRGNGFHYQNGKSIVYFYFRKNEGCSFNYYTLIVVNHLGCESEKLVCELAEAAKTLNIASIIKNVDRDKVPVWESMGFVETVAPWSSYSFRDDNTFPELVYSIESFLNLDFSIRTRALIKRISRENNYVFVSYDESFKAEGIRLLEESSEYLENKGVDSKKEVVLAHKFVFDERIKNKEAFSILEGNKLIGVSFLTRVEETVFFNAIINEKKPNLMRFLLWKSVQHYCQSLKEGALPLYLALQGSENEGQSKWKKFFHPFRAIHRTHVINKIIPKTNEA